MAQACGEIHEGHIERQHRPLAPGLPRGQRLSYSSVFYLKETIVALTFPCLLTPQQPRTEWVLSWPGQVVIAGCQVFWTTEVSEALEQEDLSSNLYPQLQTQVSARSLDINADYLNCFLEISMGEL